MLPNETPIESWKEIGAYLQRDATTARRWEREEGLPVHRHTHKSRSSVYAYASEIDSWRASRKLAPEPRSARSLWRVPAFAMTMLACLIMVGNGIRPQAASAQQGRTLAKRLVCADCANMEASFSPDGHQMVVPDDNGDIAIRDMSTEKVKRLLARIETSNDSSKDEAEFPVFSPDLRQVVYQWTRGKGQNAQLRFIQNEPGAKPRVLIDNAENTYYEPVGWFPDNKSVLVAFLKADKTWQLVRVSVADGLVKPLKSLEWRVNDALARAPVISPDGRYIVYAARVINPSKPRPAPTDPKDQHIYILAVDGSSETEIVKTAGINSHPAWTPDGKHILFTSDRSGSVDLWSIAVRNGKAAGNASLVSSGIGNIEAFGMHGGSYYYHPESEATYYVSVAEMKPSGEKAQNAARASESFVGQTPSWSPDGKSVSLKRLHPGSQSSYDVVVHSLETGEERTYLTTLGNSGPGAATWFHDGKSVLTGIQLVFYRIDLKTGDFKELPGAVGPRALSPDDKTMYVVPRLTRNLVSAVDLNSGQQRQIFTMPAGQPGGIQSLSLSPDGRVLAIMLNGPESPRQIRIARIAVDGSDYREVFATPADPGDLRLGGTLAWTRDGRGILFDMRKAVGDPDRIMRVSTEGGTPEFTGFEVVKPIQSFDLSPDGSRIAYTVHEISNELWALDNVLTVLK